MIKNKKIRIAPSILSADFSKLASEVRDVVHAGADQIHVDVMDGHFVPNLTIGPVVVKSIRPHTRLPLDVHLMITEPLKYVKAFRDAGADWITVHTEADNVLKSLKKIRSLGAKAGISLRPRTPLKAIRPYLKDVDVVLVMTVEPGFGGQSFMRDQLKKIEELRTIYRGFISVDGGINGATGAACVAKGADILVAGSFIFGRKNRKTAIQELRSGEKKNSKKVYGY